MPDREKLMSLIWHKQDCGLTHNANGQDFVTYNAELADHLISHGVTVRERGRWEFHGGDDDMNLYGFCPKCHANWDEEIMEKFNFCPNCGADMR